MRGDDPVLLHIDTRGLEVEHADASDPVRERGGRGHGFTVDPGSDIRAEAHGEHACVDSRLGP